jgi:anthranilate/para-aminobenzoate synthase component I
MEKQVMSWFATLDNLALALEERAEHWICFLRSETEPLARHPAERDYSMKANVSHTDQRDAEAFVRCTFIARPKLLVREYVPSQFFAAASSDDKDLTVFLIPFFSPDSADAAQAQPCLKWAYEDFIELEGPAGAAVPQVRTGGSLLADLPTFADISKCAELALQKKLQSCVQTNQSHDTNLNCLWKKNQTAESVRQMISQLQSGMLRGDYYLANATTRLEGPSRESAPVLLQAFVREWLRSPVRQGVFVGCGKDLPAICCFSPERFILRKGAFVQVEPIKGTAPLLANVSDSGVAALWSSEKEMSEQRLVTDLLRNDLNRVCRAGSVSVLSPCEVHAASALLQMQSVVTGELADATMPHARLLGELLPAGSVSGTPKWAVSREIVSIEHSPRGYYTGVFACASSHSDLDSAVLIRGFFANEKEWSAGIGAGITTLSDPDAEVREFELKWQSFAQRWERMTRMTESTQCADGDEPS